MDEEEVVPAPPPRRRIVRRRLSANTRVEADVEMINKKKYFMIRYFGVYFQYIDDDTIGEQLPQEPMDIIEPIPIPKAGMVAPNEPEPLRSELELILVNRKLYYVSACRKFYTYIDNETAGEEVEEPFFSDRWNRNEDLATIRDVKLTTGQIVSYRLVPGRCLIPYDKYTGDVSINVEETSTPYNPILPKNLTNFYCRNLKLTSLPALPACLRILHCNRNLLTCLPPLPACLKELVCSMNLLKELPSLPLGLEELCCSRNQLQKIPSLPESMRRLYVSNNQLTELPVLPSNLHYLFCRNNRLCALPTLPESLGMVDCCHNRLGVLPPLPPTLDTLWCANCHLKTLPPLPETLTRIDYSHNRVRGVVEILPHIMYYKCNYNPITKIIFGQALERPVIKKRRDWHRCGPSNPLGYDYSRTHLRKLYCNHTRLTELPELPPWFRSLDCSYTPLIALPAKLPEELFALNCSHTPVKLIPDLPESIHELHCSYTQIRTLPNIPITHAHIMMASSFYLSCKHTQIKDSNLLRYIENHRPYTNNQIPNINYYTYALRHKDELRKKVRNVVHFLQAIGKDNYEYMAPEGGRELPACITHKIACYFVDSYMHKKYSLAAIIETMRKSIETPIVLPEEIQ